MVHSELYTQGKYKQPKVKNQLKKRRKIKNDGEYKLVVSGEKIQQKNSLSFFSEINTLGPFCLFLSCL